MVKTITCTVVSSIPINKSAQGLRLGRRIEYDDPRCDFNAGRFAVPDEGGPRLYTASARVRGGLNDRGAPSQVDIRA